MGSSVIIIIASILIVYKDAKRHGEADGLKTIFWGLVAGCLVCLITVVPISAYLAADSKEENSVIEVECVKEETYELQEFQPDVYIITSVQRNYRGFSTRKLSIKIDGEPQQVNLYGSIIYFNVLEAQMITRKYKFKNPVLKIMLFDWGYTIRELYTPETMIYGEYDITTVGEE